MELFMFFSFKPFNLFNLKLFCLTLSLTYSFSGYQSRLPQLDTLLAIYLSVVLKMLSNSLNCVLSEKVIKKNENN